MICDVMICFVVHWEVMISHERLYNRQYLHLNLSYTNFTDLILWDGMLHSS